ncbi:hypothetical protein [Bradyrhizobium sp.]|uniref:hypothetical protein n=1 Tax=Bradyrhizobium sp. TaxID=376 RepID=UPI0025C087F8|nr:hypothetical protein [Bradyrhizobium sp.]
MSPRPCGTAKEFLVPNQVELIVLVHPDLLQLRPGEAGDREALLTVLADGQNGWE